jgi:hypothetical protein
MLLEKRKGRVTFDHVIIAYMMAIDGTWRRDCKLEDVSENGARLTVLSSFAGLQLQEFFLLLSSTGLAYRRCELAWIDGAQIGVNFLKRNNTEFMKRPLRLAKPEDAQA